MSPLAPQLVHWVYMDLDCVLSTEHGTCCFSVSVEEMKAGQGEGRKDKDGSRPGVSAALDVTSALRPLCRV